MLGGRKVCSQDRGISPITLPTVRLGGSSIGPAASLAVRPWPQLRPVRTQVIVENRDGARRDAMEITATAIPTVIPVLCRHP